MRTVSIRATGVLSALLAASYGPQAAAHSMGVVYNLPIPFWMYAFAASAALALSFLVLGFLVTAVNTAGRPFPAMVCLNLNGSWGAGVLAAARALSVLALLVAIVAGLVGPANPFANFSMTFFWIIFVLGFSYLTALLGDIYGLINPWRVIGEAAARFRMRPFVPRLEYPAWLGYYPALAMYMAFIWVELFGHASPRTLAEIFIVYGFINAAGAMLFGPPVWFRYAEFFGVFLRLIGKIAPVEYAGVDAGGARASAGEPRQGEAPQRGIPQVRALRVRLRPPFVGLLEEDADHISLIIFVLFMLSSTAFDGLHETLPWVKLFWKGLYPVLNSAFQPSYLVAVDLYYAWQWLMLFLSPLVYLAIYLFFVWLMKRATGSRASVRELALKFALALVPIAVVYHITHYYTLLIDQAPAIVPQASDPFGWGWDLFGTARHTVQPVILLASSVWHTQVGLILAGHIVSVYLAHLEALRTFGRAKQAVLSQLPMLVLMMLFTTMGLWILSLPIAAGQVQDPAPVVAPNPSSGLPQ